MTDHGEAALLSSADQLREAVAALLGDSSALSLPSQELRGFATPELGVLRLASWLFSFRRESARNALDFVLDASGQDSQSEAKSRDLLLHYLRTYFQHHLTNSPGDSLKRQQAQDWLGGDAPFENEESTDWASALRRLTSEAKRLLEQSTALAKSMTGGDEMPNSVAERWGIYQERSIPAHEVDELIQERADLLGLGNLDVQVFRERHYAGWRKQLQLLTQNISPRDFLGGLVERELVNVMRSAPLPVSGDDVMDAFGVRPGREVGVILAMVERLHAETPGTKDELLHRAAEALGRPLYS